MTNSTIPKPLHLAIIGGGIGGLALAIGLQKYPHINFTIYESHSSFGEIGAGIGFTSNGHRAMSLISTDLYESYKTIALFSGAQETRRVASRYLVGEAGINEGKEIIEVAYLLAWSRALLIGRICWRCL
jgi:salicylate hydroxylase